MTAHGGGEEEGGAGRCGDPPGVCPWLLSLTRLLQELGATSEELLSPLGLRMVVMRQGMGPKQARLQHGMDARARATGMGCSLAVPCALCPPPPFHLEAPASPP